MSKNYIDDYCKIISSKKDNILVINEKNISVRKEDGFINVTEIIKSSKNKKYNDWVRLKTTEEFLSKLLEDLELPKNKEYLIKIEINVSNDKKGTWAHPLVAINIAQWASVDFGIKVSKWIFKLLTHEKVSLKDKDDVSSDMESWKKKIEEAENNVKKSLERENELKIKLDELKEKYNTNKKFVEILQEKNKQQDKVHEDLSKKYISSQKKHTYHKFKKGPCYYILSGKDCIDKNKKIVTSFKHGIAGTGKSDINNRLRSYRTTSIGLKVEYIVYFEEAALLEKQMQTIFKKKLISLNHEWFSSNEEDFLNKFKNEVNNYLENYFNGSYTIETEEELSKYNSDQRTVYSEEYVINEEVPPPKYEECKEKKEELKIGKYTISQLKSMDLCKLLNTDLEKILMDMKLPKSGVKSKKIERILEFTNKISQEI